MSNTITYSNASDETLMKIYQDESLNEVFAILYQRYSGELIRFIFWLGKDYEVAKDICQISFEKLYLKPESYDSTKQFKVWLFVVAKNAWINDKRNHQTRNKLNQKMINEHQQVSEGRTEMNVKLELIMNALKTINEKQQEVFVLKYSNNLTISEIAKCCNCSEGTVKSRLFYAIKNLRKKIDNELILET